MAKVGLDSFLLDCHTNDNISEIESAFGVKGFAIVVRLWQKIYSEQGYYCEWTERSPLLFLANWFGGNSGVTVRLISDIVERCLRNGIFHAGMYENYSILTSARIQEHYFNVVKRRIGILVKKEYLLVSVAKIEAIVYENGISVCRNSKNVCRNHTSKVKESKVNNTYGVVCSEPENLASEPPAITITLNDHSEYGVMAERVSYYQELYPGVDVMAELRSMKGWCDANPSRRKTRRGIERFINNWLAREQNRSRNAPQPKKSQNRFDNFEQRDYDYDALLKKINGDGQENGHIQ